jgi:Methyltransferase domain
MIASRSASLMNPATDLIWLCAPPGNLRAHQLAAQLMLTPIVQNVRLDVFATSGAAIDIQAATSKLLASGYVKCFENAYMPNDLATQTRQQLVRGYFDVVSSSYGQMTQHGLNAACYELLLSEVKKLTPRLESCLDFGCGPGTIVGSTVVATVPDVVGWDFSERMCQLARAHGLPVLRAVEFQVGLGRFDAVLAAYVFHYGTVSARTLRLISEHLRVGGVLAANFHKDIGLSQFMSTLRDVPCLQLNATNTSGIFGTIAVVSRSS